MGRKAFGVPGAPAGGATPALFVARPGWSIEFFGGLLLLLDCSPTGRIHSSGNGSCYSMAHAPQGFGRRTGASSLCYDCFVFLYLARWRRL
jgi:hypothetical protein